jgi:O-acetyl-ADP-ribose deacetylase (regulator of RNase III)
VTVEHRVGDLFAQWDVDALGQGVNCRGVMGSGIAPLFKARWRDMYLEYRALCKKGGLTLGGLFPWPLPNGRWIYNMATQDLPGRNAELAAVSTCMEKVLAHAQEHGVGSVALPRIGSGVGGLDWPDVAALIEQVAGPSPVRVVLVSLPGA